MNIDQPPHPKNPLEGSYSFEEISFQAIPESVNTGLFKESPDAKFYVCPHQDGGKTYIRSESDWASFIDSDVNGRNVGFGSIEIDRGPNVQGKGTHVTSTTSRFRGEGLGTRRLMLMSQFSKNRFGVPLYSSAINTASEAGRLWERLAKEGKVKEVTFPDSKYESKKRYYFIA